MSSDYIKAHLKYRELAKAAAEGNAVAKADKAKVMNEIRGIEREAARAGTVLSATYRGDKVEVQAEEGRSKRSLQEEYCAKFDDEAEVEIQGVKTTLKKHHERRLLGKGK